MKKAIIIVGESASGKDTLKNLFLQAYADKRINVNQIVSHTTRPKRDYEIDGVDYFFTDSGKMALDIINGEYCEVANFNGWHYGTKLSSLSDEDINIGVFNAQGAFEMADILGRENCYIIYIDVLPKIRLVRALMREQDPNIEEIFRRYKYDEVDIDLDEFKRKEFWDLKVENNALDTNSILVETVKTVMEELVEW